jgi:hypothetical protein
MTRRVLEESPDTGRPTVIVYRPSPDERARRARVRRQQAERGAAVARSIRAGAGQPATA